MYPFKLDFNEEKKKTTILMVDIFNDTISPALLQFAAQTVSDSNLRSVW